MSITSEALFGGRGDFETAFCYRFICINYFHNLRTKGNTKYNQLILPQSLRRRVNAINNDVTVFTGTHGVMVLPDRRGRMQEVYLHSDANNNPDVPVPMYFYKVSRYLDIYLNQLLPEASLACKAKIIPRDNILGMKSILCRAYSRIQVLSKFVQPLRCEA